MHEVACIVLIDLRQRSVPAAGNSRVTDKATSSDRGSAGHDKALHLLLLFGRSQKPSGGGLHGRCLDVREA
jgi:hypothetical protein